MSHANMFNIEEVVSEEASVGTEKNSRAVSPFECIPLPQLEIPSQPPKRTNTMPPGQIMNSLTTRLYTEIKEQTEKYVSEDVHKSLIVRDKFAQTYSWAIPSEDIVKEIAKFIGEGIALEVGAGTGLWAHLLKCEGVQIIPTDITIPQRTFLNVIECDAESAVKKFLADTLILIWPPVYNPMASAALKNFEGSQVVYIGEGYYGCTADDNFHRLLEENWKMIKRLHNPTWSFIRDFVGLYTRIR